MRFYIAYKFLGIDKTELKTKLNIISTAIEKANNETYIFFRDAQKWGEKQIPISQILVQAFAELKKSDIFFAFVESKEKSEGLLLEAGYAKAENKKIIIAIKKDVNLRFLRSIADAIIEYDRFEDIIESLQDLSNLSSN